MRVLVLEDDDDLRGVVARRLRRLGFAVDEAEDLRHADDALHIHRYDCLVLDRIVPDGDSIEFVARLRAEGQTVPALFLTARREGPDRVAGFDAGADDYVVKPFGLDELAARVGALCRRGGRVRPTIAHWGDIEVDRAARAVRRAGILLPLTPKEFALLEVLVEAQGAAVGRAELVERCWDEHADLLSNSVNVHVGSLRRKLGEPPVIRTVRGGGYALDVRAGV